jgi:glycerate 2-kinase
MQKTHDLKRDLLKGCPIEEQVERMFDIIHSALEEVAPDQCINRFVQREGSRIAVGDLTFDLAYFEQVKVVAIGKAAIPMAQSILEILGEYLAEGFVITKHLSSDDARTLPSMIQVCLGSHPVPDEKSISCSKKLVKFLAKSGENDLILFLISGGGSALACLPVEGVSLSDIQATTRSLLACGAEIQEMNTIRKHLDIIKGGGLARIISPAQMITFALSDVVGNSLDVIASGPTVPDSSTYGEAISILEKYKLEMVVPRIVWEHLENGRQGIIRETPKVEDSCFTKAATVLVGSNYQAATAALREAKRQGVNTLLLTTSMRGEARDAGRFIAGIASEIDTSGHPVKRPACIIAGGETTVVLRGNGLGGRNLEVALGAVTDMAGLKDAYLVTIATDGEDGPTDAAGAVVSGNTFREMKQRGLNSEESLALNDSYHFFEELEKLIKLGPTGTNVNDLAFLFVF